ncbi:MAG: 30S ribosomal protein S5 [Candidatus Margulisbacteria bacterium GWF2_35_9]|nr:MAG: 30S ribosomal protein S5 [Candidatus Margulisbacteria bacterium GWF2_35_9]
MEKYATEFIEKIVQIRRVTKVVKGGKRLAFRATVVVGDANGNVGVGVSKAKEVPSAIKKAITVAKRQMIKIEVINGTIPHEVIGKLGASRIFLKPAPKGTGVIAGGVVRLVLELAGIHNIVTKSQGASSIINNAFATIDGLKQLMDLSATKTKRGIDVSVRFVQ